MKKVVCVDPNANGNIQDPSGPQVEKGKIYTVTRDIFANARLAYVLLEMPQDWFYVANMFIDLIEDQQDETCFVRDYNKETV